MLTAAQVPHRCVFLGPLGRRELREMVKLHVLNAPVDLVERVLKVIVDQRLPRTPLMMSALITVLANLPEASSPNDSGLLNAYVGLLLGSNEQHDVEHLGMDYRRREHLLGWFAGQLTTKFSSTLTWAKAVRVPRLQAEAAFGEYLSKRGLKSASPGQILISLLERRILTEDLDGVGFRHPALLHLFAAKWMSEEEGFTFATMIKADCLSYWPIVNHAAGLSRDAKDLLTAVRDAHGAVVEDVSHRITIAMFDIIKTQPGWSSELPALELVQDVPLPAEADEDDEFDARFEVVQDMLDEDEVLLSRDFRKPMRAHDRIRDLDRATLLLTTVLQKSELVPDMALKKQVFKSVIHAWSLLTITSAADEDETAGFVSRLHAINEEVRLAVVHEDAEEAHENGPVATRDKDADEELGRAMAVISVAMTTLQVVGQLGTVHMEEVALGALVDEEFMAQSAHAYFATMFYVGMEYRGWPERLEALYWQHRSHPIIERLARTFALITYQDGESTVAEDRVLEKFIANIYTEAVPARGRADARGRAISDLRNNRERQKRRGSTEKRRGSTDLLADSLDELVE